MTLDGPEACPSALALRIGRLGSMSAMAIFRQLLSLRTGYLGGGEQIIQLSPV